MLKYIKFLAAGILFGVIMAKAEVISWYRIYEMFHFDSFHMYGIIGSAVLLGIVSIRIIKRQRLHATTGAPIRFHPKQVSVTRYLAGGIIFGLGWALAGACPGPMLVLLGYGYAPLLLVIAGALLGTFVYGMLRERLPH